MPRPAFLASIGWLVWAFALGCQPNLRSVKGGPGADAGAPGTTDPARPTPGIGLPDAGQAEAGVIPRPPSSGEQCAEEAITGEMIPLDLVLVLDASGSMRVMVGGKTRWQQVADALGTFVRDPRAAGLGVGVQTFPFTIFHKPCTNNADCGYDTGPPGYWCTRPYVCNGPGVALETARACDPNDAYCPEAGTGCVVAGRCATSGARCA